MKCEHLDDYLDRLLTPDQSAAFEQHADGCPDCRAEIESTQQLYQTIRVAVDQLEPCPASLTLPEPTTTHKGPERSTARKNRRAQLSLVTSLTAITLLTLLMVRPPVTPVEPLASGDTGIPSVALPPPEITLPAGVMGFPVESSDPNIRIVMLYNQTRSAPETPAQPLP